MPVADPTTVAASGYRMPDACPRRAAVHPMDPLWGRVAAAMLIGILQFGQSVHADDSASPLAECKVQTINAASGSMASEIAMPVNTAQRALIDYRRLPNGDWNVPASVDRTDAGIRILVATPDGPLLVKLMVTVDGVPFREMTEGWIDTALEPDGEAADSPAGSDGADDSAAGTAEGLSTAEEPSGIQPQSHRRLPSLDRLREYVARSRIAVDREEARWLLAQWMPGPALLELRAGFAADRAHVDALWSFLDGDGDRTLSASELDDVVTRLRACDTNEDDWVDQSELTTGQITLLPTWTAEGLLTVLSESTDWSALARQLGNLYGPSSDRSDAPLAGSVLGAMGVDSFTEIPEDAARQLLDNPPHVHMRVNFTTNSEGQQHLLVEQLSDPLSPSPDSLIAADKVISLALGATTAEFSAGKQAGNAGQNWMGQIAVGAIADGSPLMRLVDGDNDHRLSLREVESLPEILAGLDRNGNGAIEALEMPVPIRIAVSLGPCLHDLFRTSTPSAAFARPSVAPPPDWFVGMDENKDRELTPAEFLGTREQFMGLDEDGNGRISLREAAAFDPATE